MESSGVHVTASKNVAPDEYASLMGAVGWGTAAAYSPEAIQRSLDAYPFIAHARDERGLLVGYISAFSDGAFSTFIGELVVHPAAQGRGVGRRLLEAAEAYAKGVPVYVKPLAEKEGFFLRQGYRKSKGIGAVLFKRNQQPA